MIIFVRAALVMDLAWLSQVIVDCPCRFRGRRGCLLLCLRAGGFLQMVFLVKMQNWHTILILNKRIEMNSSGRMVPLHPRGL